MRCGVYRGQGGRGTRGLRACTIRCSSPSFFFFKRSSRNLRVKSPRVEDLAAGGLLEGLVREGHNLRHARESKPDAALYISLVTLHVKFTGRCENEHSRRPHRRGGPRRARSGRGRRRAPAPPRPRNERWRATGLGGGVAVTMTMGLACSRRGGGGGAITADQTPKWKEPRRLT
jgi:hypothetical protein